MCMLGTTHTHAAMRLHAPHLGLTPAALIGTRAGHYHPGGFTCRGGRGWVGVQAILEAPVDGNAYALVHVYPDRVVIDCRGTDIPSRSLAVPPA